MFNKALWMRNWKQGKYVIVLFWISTLCLLPYRYYSNALHQAKYLRETTDTYYSYHLSGDSPTFFPALLLIGLAVILIGWERHNQTNNFLWSMPFKRSHLFSSKWLFGTVHIVSALSISWFLMYIIYKTTIHADYQSFTPFHLYFVYTIMTLIAVYTLSLFIGSITGNIVSQGALSYILLVFPIYISQLAFPFFALHVDLSEKEYDKVYRKSSVYIENTSTLSPLMHFNINYDYQPQREAIQDEYGELHVGPAYHHIPSTWTLLSPAIYILICLPLGAYLYACSPNEHNGKILLYQKLHIYFSVCTSICFGLLGSEVFTDGSKSVPLHYMYFIGFGILTYAILQWVLKHKLSLYAK
ncbi:MULTISPECIES: ABC transporter permease subunit [unclassified Bacillus (in: firmicutes)]|uniref:ABC transporter permease subunit n=1 Tax=unclassified Bacillus (in: firmicutes) TaxID=185979 RepID=UPI0008EF50A1|nr:MULTISPECIES: ABC transporter permease subunit [unclassified Bacillus (in: firmicutes)]SFI54231.1 ABC-2 family transporter protein [Bacillus sp. 71mf]SFS47311.1 ABC-2 family transporter protein [Bacillus sp. 103mf]